MAVGGNSGRGPAPDPREAAGARLRRTVLWVSILYLGSLLLAFLLRG